MKNNKHLATYITEEEYTFLQLYAYDNFDTVSRYVARILKKHIEEEKERRYGEKARFIHSD